jgi:TolA-binding protein
MDFTAILGALPTLGPIGLVLLILAYVGRQWLSSDKRYQAEIERLNRAHEAELARINAAHDEEIKELRDDIRDLRREMDELRKALAAERTARMDAQEEAHRIRMQSGTDLG